jgi:sugar phosphate isomerase/epimerase
MLLGYNTNGFAHHRLEDAVTILAELGYQSVAITLDQHTLNPFDPDISRHCESMRVLLDKLELRCVIETGARFLLDPRRKHQPTLLSDAPGDCERRSDFLLRAIDMAQLLGADAVSFWSGAPESTASEGACWIRIVGACRMLADEAAKSGMRLAFEPEPGMFIDTMAKFAELHRRVDHPNFGLTLDVGHLHCLGETPIAAHIEQWKDRLWNVHIEDMQRGVHDHLMFGAGEMEFGPILHALKAIGYDGGVHVELSRHSHDAVNTARRALTFLQGIVEDRS